MADELQQVAIRMVEQPPLYCELCKRVPLNHILG